jgi:hypothetical protein
MIRTALSIGALGIASIAAGCECGAGLGISVDLRSNLSPGVEVDRARVEIYRRGQRSPIAMDQAPIAHGDSLGRAIRILDVDGVEPGSYDVIVTIEKDGAEIASRTTHTTIRTTTLVTVLISRDCLAVTCPEGESCRSGACVPNECSETQLDRCPTSCDGDDDCATSTSCASAECVEGACLVFGDDERCAGGEYCHPEQGCVPLPGGAADGGTALCTNGEVCNDGVYCNGVDTCGAGACAVHPGNPCPGASVCNEAEDRCEGCASDADCPGAEPGAWSECTFGDACTADGTRSRNVTSHRCMAGTCTPSIGTETEGCTRPSRENAECGATTCGDYGACDWSGGCAELASQTRSCSERRCRAGTCADVGTVQARDCARETDGMDCGSRCDPYGSCDWADECAQSATRTRTCYDRSCGDGTCRTATREEEDTCTRSTENDRCGSNPSYCGSTTSCHTCMGGSCVLNWPHYDPSCLPSCGEAANLCGSSAYCCNSTATGCSQVGPTHDCDVCCAADFCF